MPYILDFHDSLPLECTRQPEIKLLQLSKNETIDKYSTRLAGRKSLYFHLLEPALYYRLNHK